MDPDVLRIAQIIGVVVLALSFLSVVTHSVRVLYMREKRKSELPEAMTVDDSRFERLERAVDAIALEVERMTEAQRFTAKLMSERPPERLAATADSLRDESR